MDVLRLELAARASALQKEQRFSRTAERASNATEGAANRKCKKPPVGVATSDPAVGLEGYGMPRPGSSAVISSRAALRIVTGTPCYQCR